MKYAPMVLLVLAAGCGDDPSNPETLYLAPDGSETRVKLQEDEPTPW